MKPFIGGGAALAPDFTKTQNILNVLLQAVALGLVAIGQTVVILSGGLDLSVAPLSEREWEASSEPWREC